jgi:hypothetical protein
MLELLESVFNRAKALRRTLRSHAPKLVARKSLRDEARSLGSLWHQEVLPKTGSHIQPEALQRYSDAFTRLIRLSEPNNQVKSYLEALDAITKPFQEDFLIPARQGAFVSSPSSEFDAFLASITDSIEGEYFAEAIACAKHGYLRAAVVLGWSAAIDRIHRSIEAIGFQKFNNASIQMAGQQAGRYKKFNQKQNVDSLSDIREVFDNVILWIIEGMGLIDTNQHTRLRSCFDMRCHSAHPGEAPITTYNLLSFFSDLDQIVFKNPKFKPGQPLA